MRVLILVGLGWALTTGSLAAQARLPIPTQQRPDSAQRADTVKVPAFRFHPPISPMGAFGRSLLLPGWGQSALGRRGTGAFFVFFEGVALGMTLKASHQLGYIEASGDTAKAHAKRQEIQDWAVLLGFNHLVAGAEAFISAELWDFPVQLETRALPAGRMGVGIRVPLGPGGHRGPRR